MVAGVFPRSGTTYADFCRIRFKERGINRRNVIVVTISSSILIKNLRRICDEKIFAISVSDNKIMIYDIHLSLYMVEAVGSNPLSFHT